MFNLHGQDGNIITQIADWLLEYGYEYRANAYYIMRLDSVEITLPDDIMTLFMLKFGFDIVE
jgi:hypothetical protein